MARSLGAGCGVGMRQPLAVAFGCSIGELNDLLTAGTLAGKHNELLEIGNRLGISRASCLQIIAVIVCRANAEAFSPLVERVASRLQELA